MLKKILIVLLLLICFTNLSYAKVKLEDRVTSLEKRLIADEEHYNQILTTQRFIYNINVVVLCTIVAFALILLGVTWWFEVRGVRKYIQKKFKKIEKEFLKNTQKTREDLEVKILFTYAASYGNNCLATAKMLLLNMPALSALWYMRAAKSYYECNSSDLVQTSIISATERLEEAHARKKYLKEEDIVETEDILQKIKGEKFNIIIKDFRKTLYANKE